MRTLEMDHRMQSLHQCQSECTSIELDDYIPPDFTAPPLNFNQRPPVAPESQYSCDWMPGAHLYNKCRYSSSEKDNLIYHFYGSHIRSSFVRHEYICYWQNCTKHGETLGDLCELMQHCRIHTGEKIFKCDHCNSSFVTWEEFINHLTTYHIKLKIAVTTPKRIKTLVVVTSSLSLATWGYCIGKKYKSSDFYINNQLKNYCAKETDEIRKAFDEDN
ncbi:hypothetical protein A3Q56_05848 [Intoshia linei]|uniref:C2H2-type domain-containing protein n=1 Tax=Intoshia linei TaxID=1819745 RepID=A0A177AX54_9BILA|nr:hypothetical protein A3Q56_05848 [Intoshia linei]